MVSAQSVENDKYLLILKTKTQRKLVRRTRINSVRLKRPIETITYV